MPGDGLPGDGLPGDGLLVVDKPAGWTSHDLVARARRICGTRRVGHAGTLDPMATGVLVLGVGRATKLLTFLVGADKAYTATIRLGQSTVTDDAEGEVTDGPGVPDVAGLLARLPSAVAELTGDLEQVPSAVSAIKVKGVRSYTRVRRGDTVELPARPVTVSRFEIITVRPAHATETQVVDVDVEVEVSTGTYVRALARDLGVALGTGGHLTALRRTRVGPFTLDDAVRIDEPDGGSEPERTAAAPRDELSGIRLIPMGDAARAYLPVHDVSAEEARLLGHGQRIPSRTERRQAVAAIGPAGRLVAILDESGPLARAHVVFPEG